MPFSLRPLLVIALVVTATGLSACGRRGPLEPPPRSANPVPTTLPETDEAGNPIEEAEAAASTAITPPIGQDKSPRRGFITPKRPFVLDPIL